MKSLSLSLFLFSIMVSMPLMKEGMYVVFKFYSFNGLRINAPKHPLLPKHKIQYVFDKANA